MLPFVLLVAACSGATKPAESAPQAASKDEPAEMPGPSVGEATESEPAAATEAGIPSRCYDGGQPCTPDPRWVKKLCADVYPAVALYLFQASSPFTHAYLSRKTRAVNASGGATSGDEWLAFDEEVVLLYHRSSDAGGIQVSGSNGGYDAMRLDGSCVTLDAEEVRLEKPPAPKYSTVPWRYIGDDMQNALLEVPSVKAAYVDRRKECQGAFSGTVSSGCIKKDEALNRAIIAALQSGTARLPEPAAQP